VTVASGFWSALIASLISTNRFFGFGGFLPLPSVDGEVIWRELLRPIFSRLQMKKVSSGTDSPSSPSNTSQDNE